LLVGIKTGRASRGKLVAAKSNTHEFYQDYYLKNPARYAYYRNACGRDKYLSQVWGADAVDDHAVPSGGDPPPFGAK
jgi:hypothetical protein